MEGSKGIHGGWRRRPERLLKVPQRAAKGAGYPVPHAGLRALRTVQRAPRGGGRWSVDRAMAERLGRRVMVLGVENERFGRTCTGREGRVLHVSRDPDG